MRTMTAGQLRARLGEALDQASRGERIVIERDHVPIAAIVPIEDAQQLQGDGDDARQRKLAAMERIRERGELMRRLAPPPDDGFPDTASWIRWERERRWKEEP